MTLQQIREAVDQGKKVYCGNNLYRVVSDNLGQYFIVCLDNNYAIGLTWRDNTTLNGKESEFYIGEG